MSFLVNCLSSFLLCFLHSSVDSLIDSQSRWSGPSQSLLIFLALHFFLAIFYQTCPSGLIFFTWWGCCGFVFDTNQPSLPTPFSSVLVSVSVFMALSTVFHSINSPENSPLSHSVLHWSFQLHNFFVKVSLSPDIILCG